MKLINTLLFTFVLTMGTLAQTEGDILSKEVRKIDSFDRIKASKGINVTLIEGEEESIKVEIKNAELSDVITELKSRELVIKMKTKFYKDVAVQVYVTYKSISEINAGSGATVDANNTIYADKLILRAGTESYIALDVDVNTIQASGGASRMELGGVCNVQEINMGTGAKYLAFALKSNEAVAKATLGSVVEVTVNDKLNAITSSGGVVDYKGNPEKVESKENTGGKVMASE